MCPRGKKMCFQMRSRPGLGVSRMKIPPRGVPCFKVRGEGEGGAFALSTFALFGGAQNKVASHYLRAYAGPSFVVSRCGGGAKYKRVSQPDRELCKSRDRAASALPPQGRAPEPDPVIIRVPGEKWPHSKEHLSFLHPPFPYHF